MTATEKIFCIVLLVNTVTAILYMVCGCMIRRRKKKADILMKGMVMFLCPVVGPMFFFTALVFNKIFFRQYVDLEDVIFSKERVKTHLRADEEREGNLVPIEEALAISDKDSLRTLVMNVVRGDVQNSLASISLALNSEDTETSHYAATVLRDALNDFRKRSQELYLQMKQEGEQAAEAAGILIEYMYGVLIQEVFHEKEQRTYIDMMEEACNFLDVKCPEKLSASYMEGLCTLLLKIRDFKRMKYWCDKSRERYPHELSTYTCYLKLYFTEGNKKEFFEELEKLKSSDIVIDKETLELIRIFS